MSRRTALASSAQSNYRIPPPYKPVSMRRRPRGYVGGLNFNGTDILTIVASDLGNTGAGGALTDSKIVSIEALSPTAQIAELRDMVEALFDQGAINQGQLAFDE